MSRALVTQEEVNQDMLAAAAYQERAEEVRARATELYARASDMEEEILSLKDSVADVSREELIEAIEYAYRQLDQVRDMQYALVATALAGRYTAADVRSWCERALEMGAGHPRLDGKVVEDLMYLRRVPNALFRERLLAIGAAEKELRDPTDIHPEEAWVTGRHAGDQRYIENSIQQEVKGAVGWDDRLLRRNLGMNTRPGFQGYKSLTLFIDYETASRLAPTLGLKPSEAGI